MRYLAAEAILAVHDAIIEATGGLHGVRDVGLLASLAVKPQQAFGGRDLYPTLHIKAAAYLEALARYHVFTDGNKRTALAVSDRFLYLNGWELTATNRAVETFVLKVASSKTVNLETIAAWLKRHSRKIARR